MKVEEVITQRILDIMEKGTVPWHKPWASAEFAPKNLVSKKEYNGINAFLTACSGYSSPFWASFKQITELGGSVKKGEKGMPVIYWNWVVKDEGTPDEEKIPFMRYYTVFNLEQTEGIPEDKIPKIDSVTHEFTPIEECEKTVEAMQNKPEIGHAEARAYYKPSQDSINMPKKELFDGPEQYYSTLFHELVHSTGYKTRLDRQTLTDYAPFGTPTYSREELIAEMGAAFLCGHCGIENKTIDNSAAYIASWSKRLKQDGKLVIVAAAQAQKAVNYIKA